MIDFEACGRTVGHGNICEVGYLCGACLERYRVTEQLGQAQAALRELMEVLPHLVRLAGMPDISEQPWLDRAQTYIDIYEGRTDEPE